MRLKIIWDTYNEYIVRDISVDMIEEAKRVMFEEYFIPNRLLKHLKINDDPESCKQYMKFLEIILQDECSVAIINTETNQILGIALLKCMTEENQSWIYLKFFVSQSKFTSIIELHYNMIHADVEDQSISIDCLYLFEIYINKNIKANNELISKFFEAITETARNLKMLRIACIAMSREEQELFTDYGYCSMSCALYSIYSHNNQRAFAPLREIDESEATLFELLVDPLIHFTQLRSRPIEEVNQQFLVRPSMIKKRLKSLQFGVSN